MSISTISSNIRRIQDNIHFILKQISDKRKKLSDAQSKSSKAYADALKTRSESTRKSKITEYNRQNNNIARITLEIADLEKKYASKNSELAKEQEKLQKEQIAESKKMARKAEEEAKKERERQNKVQKNYEKRISELEKQDTPTALATFSNLYSQIEKVEEQYDVFISHASEDKKDFVDELYNALIDRGLKVWYDTMSIKWGDSLRSKIDTGLKNSKFGIVVLSPHYIEKGWTQYELEGLFNIEMTAGKTILPIWHNLTKQQVQNFSPTIAGRKALSTALLTPIEIVDELFKILNDTE